MKFKVLAISCFMIISTFVFNLDVFAAASVDEPEQLAINITYKTTFETLYDSSSEKLYLLIENTTDNRMVLKNITVTTPDYIKSETENKNYMNFLIAPKKTIIIPMNIKVSSAVKPGKDVLLYDISLQAETDKGSISFNKVITVDVEMAVAVSNDILTAVGVPSLIFIPGFIILVIISSFIKPYVKSVDHLDAKNPLFWVASISIGLGVAYLYPLISGIFGRPDHDLLRNYGLEDILTVWIASVVFALLVSIPLYFILKRNINKMLYFEKDSPLKVIYKVSRYQKSTALKKINVEVNGIEKQMNLIPNNSGRLLACPDIVIEIDRKRVKKTKAINKTNNKLKKIIEKDKDISKLSSCLFFNKKKLIIDWKYKQTCGITEISDNYEILGERSFIEYK